MSKENLIPELRFPEFDNEGEWQIKEVGEIFDVTRGYVLASGNQQLTAQMWNALTGPNGLSYYFPNTGNFTVTLYLENACGSNTFTQNYSIVESINLTPNHLTICAGNQSTID
jgi:hypothetical protein